MGDNSIQSIWLKTLLFKTVKHTKVPKTIITNNKADASATAQGGKLPQLPETPTPMPFPVTLGSPCLNFLETQTS